MCVRTSHKHSQNIRAFTLLLYTNPPTLRVYHHTLVSVLFKTTLKTTEQAPMSRSCPLSFKVFGTANSVFSIKDLFFNKNLRHYPRL